VQQISTATATDKHCLVASRHLSASLGTHTYIYHPITPTINIIHCSNLVSTLVLVSSPLSLVPFPAFPLCAYYMVAKETSIHCLIVLTPLCNT
jgi:hypothetical protein